MDYLLSLLSIPYPTPPSFLEASQPSSQPVQPGSDTRHLLALHSFLWDRMRAVRADLRMQHLFGAEGIEMHERMVRASVIRSRIFCDYPWMAMPRRGAHRVDPFRFPNCRQSGTYGFDSLAVKAWVLRGLEGTTSLKAFGGMTRVVHVRGQRVW